MFEVEQEHRLTNFGVFEGNTARESGFAISNPPNHVQPRMDPSAARSNSKLCTIETFYALRGERRKNVEKPAAASASQSLAFARRPRLFMLSRAVADAASASRIAKIIVFNIRSSRFFVPGAVRWLAALPL